VAPQGIEPYPYLLQRYAQTTYAREPNNDNVGVPISLQS